MNRKIILTILCMTLLFAVGCAKKEEGPGDPAAYAPGLQESGGELFAPDFEMTLTDGSTLKFSDCKGKKVLLNFWATWCGPCVRELPALQKLSEEYPDELIVLGINCSEEAAELKSFLEKNGYTFPVALDESGAIQELFGGIDAIPTTLIIDEEGRVLAGHQGAEDADTMYNAYKADLGL